MRLVRVVGAIGAAVFLYLALIPGGLVIASVDPACSGPECGYSAVGDIFLIAVYAIAFVAMLASAASFAGLAIESGSPRSIQRLIRVLGLTAGTAGLAMFAVFAIGSPIAALVIAVIGVACFTLLWRRRERLDSAPSGDASENGASSNGHGPRLDRLPKV